MSNAVAISGLAKHFGRVKALQELDLNIEAGQIYGLLGPNGAGKSTLIKTLVGGIKPSRGTVAVLEREMPREARRVRGRLGYMPQVPALYTDLSVRANVKFFARAHKLKNLEERVDRILSFVGLEEMTRRKVGLLSGGLKQRCSLACALVHEPVLLLLDEPTAGVDPVLKESFWRHFRSLAASGTTIIITTHLMDEPLACDRIGILRKGRLILEDSPAQIVARGQTEVSFEIGGRTIRKTLTDYTRELPLLLRDYGLGPGISRLSIRHESLEDIFLKLVQGAENV